MLTYRTLDLFSAVVQRTGEWEADHLAAIALLDEQISRVHASNATRPDRRAYLDVGSNLGYFALLAASRGYHVDAFEALPTNAAIINLTLCHQPSLERRVRLHAIGLSSAPRTCVFVSGDSNAPDAVPRCDVRSAASFAQQGYTVRGAFGMSTMSDALHRDYHVAKLDVEGHEEEVLAASGADAYFGAHSISHILAESWPNDTPKRRRLLARLARIGYPALRVLSKSRRLPTAKRLGPPFDGRDPPASVLAMGQLDVLASRA